ncbi:MAG TPA: N-acetylmuramoyl-L-alanine amidase [Acetobacteraceae bacterium]|jgi:hypothetical protein|nr:N-acetylmuramoyl-L-alanine amidase [Acetobacteraceae bacterium]
MALKRDWIPSPNYSSRGGSGVRLVIVHTAEGALTYKALGNYFASGSAGVSSHTGIDDTPGRIGEYVKRPNKAWTSGDANPYSVNVELCGFAAWSPAEWERHPTMLDNCARWIAEECRHYGIPITKLGAGQTASGRGVCGHVDVSGPGGHWDPGPSFPWSKVIAAAKSGGPVYGPPPPPPWTPATLSTLGADPGAAVPVGLRTAIRSMGDEMPPEYIIKSNHPDAKGSGGYYAVYPSGLVRRIGATERDLLNDNYGVGIKNLDEKDSGSRLYEQDQALRGLLDKR